MDPNSKLHLALTALAVLICYILNAFVHKSEVQLWTVLTAWLIEPVLRGEDFDRVSAKNIRP